MSQIQPTHGDASDKSRVIGYATPTTNMPPTFAVVWCRILALWMLAWGLYTGATFVALGLYFLFNIGVRQSYPQLLPILTSQGLPGALWLLMAWYCWRKAPDLARRMTQNQDQDQNLSARGMTAEELLHIVLMGIGVYLLSDGLPMLVQMAWEKFEELRSGLPGAQMNDSYIWDSVVRCILGFWLILGTHGIVLLLRRYGGKWRYESKA